MVSFLKGFLFGTLTGILILFVTSNLNPPTDIIDEAVDYSNITQKDNNSSLSQGDGVIYKSDQELLEEVLEQLNNLRMYRVV